MRITDVIKLCRALDIYCKWSAVYQEFTVWPKDTDAERTAYFTNDKYDAVYTAVWMASERRQNRPINELMAEMNHGKVK